MLKYMLNSQVRTLSSIEIKNFKGTKGLHDIHELCYILAENGITDSMLSFLTITLVTFLCLGH